MRGPKNRATSVSRKLRANQTDAEQKLWHALRNRQISDCKFVRQKPIGRYVCDFVCRERHLIVEVDGGQHAESSRDAVRTLYLATEGYRVIRFWNNDVLTNLEGVLLMIQSALRDQ